MENTLLKKNVCREFLNCSKVLCPAYNTLDTACWLIPKTLCNDNKTEDFFIKFSSCIVCRYFKEIGENYPGGLKQFQADQLQEYNFKALARLYQKEESFIDILNRIPDGLFTTDREWRITYFNQAAERITGFPAEDALGMYCRDVFKNSICETNCALKQAVAIGHPIYNREYIITNIDGLQVPVMCSTSAFQDKFGRITGGLEIFKDISELKKLHEEIAAREKKYRRIFEGSHDMIYITNLRGDLLDVNHAGVEMMGYSDKAELLGLNSARRLYFNPEDREKFLKTIARGNSVKDYEADFVKRDGTPIHVIISSRRYENPATGDIELEGIIKDITPRKRMEKALQQRNRELAILNSIAVALNLNMDLDHILTITLKKMLKILHLSGGALFLIDKERKKPALRVLWKIPEQSPDRDDIIFKDTQLMTYLIEEDGKLSPEPAFPSFQAAYCIKEGSGKINWLTCYLIIFKGRAVGFFGLDVPSDRILSPYEIYLLGSMGNFLGGAVENIRMMKTIRRHQEELKRLTEKLFQNQEEERRRIARELHDEAGQSLTAIKLGLDRLEDKIPQADKYLRAEISDIRKMITRTSSEIREISYRLHPTLLIDLGLEPALTVYFKEVGQRSDIDIRFHMVGFDHRLDINTETVIYRFCQEALTNTLKHSGAENFHISIIKSYPNIIFIAEDDGIGFNGQISGTDKRSLGLIGMRERVSMLGGAFQIRSNPNQGTRIRIEIPLDKAASHE